MKLPASHTKNSSLLHRSVPIGLAVLVASLALTTSLRSQTDDFDDGNDVGWSRYDRTGTANFSFPSGGYRIQASSVDTNSETDKALVFSVRNDDYTNFYAAVDLRAWDNGVRSAIGLAFRAKDIGPGTTKALVLYWTPATNGGGNRLFSIYYIWNDTPLAALAATILTLDPTHSYRMVVTGVGDFIEAKMYDLNDLTQPVAYMAGHLDPQNLPQLPESGKCGVFGYSRENKNVPLAEATFDVTFDNYVAAALDPGGVPAPGTTHPIPGTPQVVNRVPVSNRNFHPHGSGISFTATTLGGNGINPSGIHLLLNGVDVSSSLFISGSTNSRSISYSGLTSNKIYQARIVLTETGGKSSTNDFYFDTFSESYITSSAVKMVEAEDYNYTNGGYQLDPIPVSGADTNGTAVNGSGVGYFELEGTRDVDFFDRRTTPELGYNSFRPSDPVGTFSGTLDYVTDGGVTPVNTNDTALQKFASQGLPDYQIHHTEGGEWLNYTRQFASGRYNVYLRLSSYSQQDVLFDEVTGDRTTTNQTTSALGKFPVTNTSHISKYRYFPLLDNLGNPRVLNWSGEKTFRLTMDGPQQDYTRHAMQMNYLMFVPAPISPVLLINPNRIGTTFSVSFASESGVTYTLQYKNSLSDAIWTNASFIGGDGTVKTLTDPSSQSARSYRVSAQ